VLKACEIVSIILLAVVGGMFWGPWLALTRTMATFEADVFLAVVRRMSSNMAPVMTVMMPLALLSTAPVLYLTYGSRPLTFSLTLAGLALFVVTLGVTVLVEVPIVTQIGTWTVSTLPDDWQARRDRWGSFHLLRVVPALVGLSLVIAGALH
jgi:hypothetical protein